MLYRVYDREPRTLQVSYNRLIAVKKKFSLLAALLTMLALPARADLMDDARAAYEAGHNEEAFKLLTRAAEQRNIPGP